MTQRIRDVAAAAGILRSGGVLILPTDTLPGLHARADLPVALARIAAVKSRTEDKPLLVLAASLTQARTLVADLNAVREEFCRHCWPGPFSLILPARTGLPPQITGTGRNESDAAQATIAVRVPAPRYLRELLTAVGVPLASTSVNLTGQPPLGELSEAVRQFGDRTDGWWAPDDDAAGEETVAAVPSALVDVTVWPPVLLRPGPRELPH